MKKNRIINKISTGILITAMMLGLCSQAQVTTVWADESAQQTAEAEEETSEDAAEAEKETAEQEGAEEETSEAAAEEEQVDDIAEGASEEDTSEGETAEEEVSETELSEEVPEEQVKEETTEEVTLEENELGLDNSNSDVKEVDSTEDIEKTTADEDGIDADMLEAVDSEEDDFGTVESSVLDDTDSPVYLWDNLEEEALTDGLKDIEDSELAASVRNYISALVGEEQYTTYATNTYTLIINYYSNGWDYDDYDADGKLREDGSLKNYTQTITFTDSAWETITETSVFGWNASTKTYKVYSFTPAENKFSFPISYEMKKKLNKNGDDSVTNDEGLPSFMGWAQSDTNINSQKTTTPSVDYENGKSISVNKDSFSEGTYTLDLYAIWNDFYVINYQNTYCTTTTSTTGYRPDKKTTTTTKATSIISSSGYYQLRSDIEYYHTFSTNSTDNKEFVFDLNGNVWSGYGSGNAVLYIPVGNDINLTIIDSNTDVEHHGSLNNYLWNYDSTGNAGVIIKGGIITGGARTQGGAIYSETSSAITIHAGTFAGNKATGASWAGGAISLSTVSGISPTFMMTGGRICYNYGTYNGGAAYLRGTVTFTGGEIDHNYAGNSGGGLRLTSQYDLSLEMSGVKIHDNVAKSGNGGGINISMGDSDKDKPGATKEISISITDSEIFGNVAGNYGGGISITQYPYQEVSLNINEGTRIYANKATLYGGGIYMESGTLTINGGIIGGVTAEEANIASGNGGGFAISKTQARDKDGSGDIVNVDFTVKFVMNGGSILNNSANLCGGGGYISNGTAEITGGSISSNTASGKGGGVYIAGGSATVGSDVSSDSASVNNSSVTISSNQAKLGGGIYLDEQGTFTLNQGTISSNTAVQGGGLYLFQSPKLYNGIIADNTAVSGDTSDTDASSDTAMGGGIYISNAMVKLSPSNEVSITGNTAVNGNGGGICVYGTSENTNGTGFSVDANAAGTIVFSGNKATQTVTQDGVGSGGAVYIYYGSCTLDNEKVTLSDNHAVSGGAVAVENGKFTMSKGSIQDCSAENGGAIYVFVDDTSLGTGRTEDDSIANKEVNPSNYDVFISGGTISGNTASANGGAICVYNGYVLVDGGTISQNTATSGSGGAIYLARNQGSTSGKTEVCVRIRSGEISGNYAEVSGGAVAVDGSADSGAAVAVEESSDSSADLKVIIGVNENHYDDKGSYAGCKHTYRDQQTNYTGAYDPCPVIRGNTSVESGGAIYITGSSSSKLYIYCMQEKENSSAGDEGQSDFLMVEGGNVIITTGTNTTNEQAQNGSTVINGTMHITGGTMDIYGRMDSPKINDIITVEVEDKDGYFSDHRVQVADYPVYWVHYYENYWMVDKDTNTTYWVGRFKAVPVEKVTDSDGTTSSIHQILSTVFNREGYVIKGWSTTSSGLSETTTTSGGTKVTTANAYEIGATYTFPSVETHTETTTAADGSVTLEKDVSDLIAFTDGAGVPAAISGDDALSTLKLYAVWIASSDTLVYDPNTDSYEGSMDAQSYSIHQTSITLQKNNYKRQGYQFTGWNTAADGKGTSYTDGASVEMTTFAGTTRLYAQWTPCKHEGTLVYTSNGSNTITESCSACGAHTATAVISAVDAVYDEKEHLAKITYSSEWLGSKDLDITYKMAESGWDEKDSVDDEWNKTTSPKPVHAGSYTASFSATGSDEETASASTTYQITRVKWGTPDSPEIEVDATKKKVTITSPVTVTSQETGDTNTYASHYEYAMSVSTSTITEAVGWTTNTQFSISDSDAYNRFLYFFARQTEDRDHETSDASKSYAYLTTNGNIIVKFVVEEGLVLTEGEAGTGDLSFVIGLEEGYHYLNYNNAAVSMEQTDLSITDNPAGSLGSNGETVYTYTVTKTDTTSSTTLKKTETSTGEGVQMVYSYTLYGLESSVLTGSTIIITVSGAAKDASVTAKVTDGQVFSDFNNKTTTISRDSAFTAQFTVHNYIPSEYTDAVLYFGNGKEAQALPAGTTIILKTEGKYYYYNLTDSSASSISNISLNDFRSMGTVGTKYSFPQETDASDTVAYISSTYQFIIDFSQVEEKARLEKGTLQIGLVLKSKKQETAAPEYQTSVSLVDPASFKLTASENNGRSGTLTRTYTASKGAASIWNGRSSALVLTATTTTSTEDVSTQLPPDLYLQVTYGSKTMTVYRNKDGQFILPFSGIDGIGNVSITLCSSLFPEGTAKYAFTAEWYISASQAAVSPLNGYPAASTTISFTVKTSSPSLRVTGSNSTDNNSNSRLLKQGNKLEVTLELINLSTDSSVSVSLLRKESDTGAYAEISTKVKMDYVAGKNTYSLDGLDVGCYCLMYTVTYDSGTFQVPYYFILLNENGKYESK